MNNTYPAFASGLIWGILATIAYYESGAFSAPTLVITGLGVLTYILLEERETKIREDVFLRLQNLCILCQKGTEDAEEVPSQEFSKS